MFFDHERIERRRVERQRRLFKITQRGATVCTMHAASMFAGLRLEIPVALAGLHVPSVHVAVPAPMPPAPQTNPERAAPVSPAPYAPPVRSPSRTPRPVVHASSARCIARDPGGCARGAFRVLGLRTRSSTRSRQDRRSRTRIRERARCARSSRRGSGLRRRFSGDGMLVPESATSTSFTFTLPPLAELVTFNQVTCARRVVGVDEGTRGQTAGRRAEETRARVRRRRRRRARTNCASRSVSVRAEPMPQACR